VLATGVLGAFKQVSIGAQVSGEIKKLNVVLGQKVKKGDVLAVIDADKQANALQSAKADLYSSEASLNSKKATLQKAKLDFARQATMIKSGATSKQEYDNAKVSLELAKTDIEVADALIEKARINVKTSEVSLGYTQVIAPIDGVVVSVAVEEGQTVNANQTTPTLMVLANLEKMTIQAEISEGDIVKIKEGMKSTFTVMGDPNKTYNATIRSIDPGPTTLTDNPNQTSSTLSGTPIYYYAMLDVPNNDGKLRISMTTSIIIEVQNIKNTLSIPALALGSEAKNGGYKVKVLTKDGDKEIVTNKIVKIGLNNGVDAQVIGGLKEGELVVVSELSDTNTNGSTKKKQTPEEAMSQRRMSSSMGG
jgi:macrolide-specific efflux system membrane fusion protein